MKDEIGAGIDASYFNSDGKPARCLVTQPTQTDCPDRRVALPPQRLQTRLWSGITLDWPIIAYAPFDGPAVRFVHAKGEEAECMRKQNKRQRKPPCRRIVSPLPDLDHANSAVLNSLSSPCSRRNYKFAMEQFISWYCSEPRLPLNRTVVLRFRLYLVSLGLATGTINQRLAAVRRLAYEAADSGLLSRELAAGIRRGKGVKQLGSRVGNWLTHDEARVGSLLMV